MSKSKWKVQCNVIAGVGKMYRAVRVIDAAKPEHSGNLEGYGEYCEDRDAVQATVDYLNEQEQVQPNEVLREFICPICGKKFLPTAPLSDYHWTHGRFKFCSYHCYLQRGKLEKVKNYRPERLVRQFSLTGEIVATYKNAAEAAKAIGYPASTIRACCNKGQPMGTGYRWEYVGEEALADEREETVESTPEKDS